MAFIFLFSFAFVSADKVTQISSTGLVIEYPKFTTVQIGEAFEFNIHVFNASNGLPVTNESVDCYLHGYYRNGTHVLKVQLDFEPPFDFHYTVPKEVFTGGKGAYVVQCNNSEGGFVSGNFDVTRTGFEFTVQEAIVYSILALGVLILFLVSFYFMISTPYSNKKNEKGEVIQITKLKYVKLGLIMLCWVLFTWFLNILIGLSDSFVYLTMYYGFFGFMFDIMNRLALPFGILILVIAGVELVRDSNVLKDIKKFGSSYK